MTDVHTMATVYTVSALPPDHRENGLFAVTVEWRGHYDGSDKWAACRHRQCLDVNGEWDWESIPSEREDDWLATHRFDLETALRLAQQAAPNITVNGFTPADVLARGTR